MIELSVEQEKTRKVEKINNIDRNKCRQEAVKRFSAQVNAKQYIEAYKKMIKLWQNQKSS